MLSTCCSVIEGGGSGDLEVGFGIKIGCPSGGPLEHVLVGDKVDMKLTTASPIRHRLLHSLYKITDFSPAFTASFCK